MRQLRPAIVSALSILALAACSRTPTTQPAQEDATGSAIAVASGPAANADFLAAAEPFEALTEGAFAGDVAALDKLIAPAQAQFDAVAGALPPGAKSAAEKDMAEIAQGRQSGDRAAIALASVDVYRQLVQSAPPQRVPVEVNLLDYAGFRYDADLKASPPRWNDARQAAALAHGQWDAIAPTVKDAVLRGKVASAIAAMKDNVASQALKPAASAAKAELDLVDELEAYFAKPHA